MRLIDLQYDRTPQGIRLGGQFTDENGNTVTIDSYLRGKVGICRYLILMVPRGSDRTITRALQSNKRTGAYRAADHHASSGKPVLNRLGVNSPVNCYVVDRIRKRVSKSGHNKQDLGSELSPESILTRESRHSNFQERSTMKMSKDALQALIAEIYREEKAKIERQAVLEGLGELVRQEITSLIAEDGKWIQKAVKEPGALHRRLGIPEDDDIPAGRIDDEIAKLHKKTKEEGGPGLTDDEKEFMGQLQFAKRAQSGFDECNECGDDMSECTEEETA